GLYVSRCGGKVDEVIDVDAAIAGVAARAAVVRVFDDLFDPAAQERVRRDVVDAELDGVVLAGHSVERYNKSLSGRHLIEGIVAAGINPNRVVAANILEQVALVHADDPVGATAKAKAVIEDACRRVELSDEAEGIVCEPRRSVLILGVTTEAVVAAQRLLQLGFSVVLADRGEGLSHALQPSSLKATSAYVAGHPNAEFVDGARISDGSGWVGDFDIMLNSDAGSAHYRVGGILLARPDVTQWIEELRGHFKVDIDENGHARSIDPDTHPSETIDPGIMVVPVRGSGDRTREKVAAADSAAMALVLQLSQPTTVHYMDVSEVDETLCGGCASCVRTCAFGACSIGEDGFSHVDVRRCRACGKCVVSCPVGARDIISAPHDYLIETIRGLADSEVEGEKVLGFLCAGCGYPAADGASAYVEESGESYPASFLPLRIPCGGRLDTLYVLEAFKAGFDGVTVFRCREGHCHNLIGNLDMDRRMNLLRTVLRSRHLDDARLRIVDISPFEGERFVEQINAVYATLGSLTNGKGGPQ
ncbi:MAG: hydrogenase iron-sulfur subunit, partial [Coriobacteriia bacterium]|nr:hydrogenase iron-sulfur subunit [Coriobacteriia bacterium]